MPIGIMGRKSLALIDGGLWCLPTRREKAYIVDTFVCAVSLYVPETPKASIKDQEPQLPIVPFGIVVYHFVGQPCSKQLYTHIHSAPQIALAWVGQKVETAIHQKN